MTGISEQSVRALKTLTDCLAREDLMLDSLLSACEEQMEALKTGNHIGVETAVGKMGHLLNGINSIETQRQESKDLLDLELGLNPEGALSDLLPHLGQEARRELGEIQRSMKDKADKLRWMNETNSIMTRQILNFNEAIMSLMNPKDGLTYGAKGAQGGISKPGRTLVNKTV